VDFKVEMYDKGDSTVEDPMYHYFEFVSE
jgi:hypothetical protein